MPLKIISTLAGVVLLALTACQKQPDSSATAQPKTEGSKPLAVDVVKETERSRSFTAVSRQLELGGTLYGYVDIDGDVLKLASGLQSLLEQIGKSQPSVAMFAKQDYGALATALGLTDIKAVGVSSIPDGTGYFRNRMFFYTGGARHGLLAGLGGKPAAFTHVNLAPADTAFYGEAEIDLPVVYRSIKDVIAKVGGEPAGNQFDAAIKKAGETAALSLLDLIYGLKGHTAVVLRLDSAHPLRLPVPPAGLAVPSVALLMCVDGVAPIVETSLANSPVFRRTDSGTMHVYEMKLPMQLEGIQPVIVADGATLYIATSLTFLKECREQKTGLGQNAEFQRAVATVGSEGNGLTYVSPRLFDELRQIQKLNPNLPAETQSVLTTVMTKFPKLDRPLVAIRTNLPDGILVRSYWDQSLKQDVAMFTAYNPVTVGLLAAMAIPAFQKVRTASQEKAVLNNLRQLAAAADQFYLERGVQAASYNDLVGPARYIKVLVSVAGENYREVRFVQGQPLRVKLPAGNVVEFAP